MSENFWNGYDDDKSNEKTIEPVKSEPSDGASAYRDYSEEAENKNDSYTDMKFDTFEYKNTKPEDTVEPVADSADTAQDSKPENYTEPYQGDTQDNYSTPYSDADNKQDNYSAPYAEPHNGNTQNNYSNPYADAYQNAQPKPSYTERPSYGSGTNQQGVPYNDGFYHKSFTQQGSGTQTNYTTPPVYQQYNAPVNNKDKKEKKSGGISKGGAAVLVIVCILLSGVTGFLGSILAVKLTQPEYEETNSDTMVIHKVNAEAQQAEKEQLQDKSTSEITTEVADTVVEITTEVVETNSFYGQYIAQGAGSGVIISDDGYIVTNNHVIEGASSIKVTTRSGESYDAKLVGADAQVDIALLKIEATGLPKAVLGDSDTLAVGDKAVIIGNPLGTLGGSVTEGIISALDRSIVIDGKTMHLLQTDAAVNPGNSGGGMFNGQGELAGIVVAKSSSTSESIDNIGFVIPINNVLNVIGDLKDYGYVRGRADTGMSFIDLSNMMYAWYYYGNTEAGVYISSVESGSNAEKAGFREGDLVVSVDGTEISTSDDINDIISGKSVGDTVTFELKRKGSTGKLELTLQEEVPDTSKKTDNSSTTNPYGDFGGNGGFGR